MENLTPEGRAIYNTVSAAAASQQERAKLDLEALIVQTVTKSVDAAVARAVDSTVRTSVNKAVADMQLYTDGVESTVQQNLEDLRTQLGLAAFSDEPEPHTRTSVGDAETGPDGRRPATTTRRPVVGATGPYIPPPARGCQQGGILDSAVGTPPTCRPARSYGFRMFSNDGGRSGYLQPGWLASF